MSKYKVTIPVLVESTEPNEGGYGQPQKVKTNMVIFVEGHYPEDRKPGCGYQHSSQYRLQKKLLMRLELSEKEFSCLVNCMQSAAIGALDFADKHPEFAAGSREAAQECRELMAKIRGRARFWNGHWIWD